MGMNRISAGIAMTMLLLALPVAASDYTLGIFGNANEDNTINMQDVTYTELIILEYRDRTELSDAKYDGKINMQDVTQIELVILGKEKELTIVDTADRTVTVQKPLKRIIVCFTTKYETLRSLKVPKDIIVGVAKEKWDTAFFPEIVDIPSVGHKWTPDIEAILNLNPDAVLVSSAGIDRMKPTVDALESVGISVLAFSCQTPAIHREEVEKLGYIFDKEEEAEEYLDWREEILNSIKENVETIPEEDKPKVYFTPSFRDGVYYIYGQYAYIETAGGRDIFADKNGKYMSVDAESVMERDPDIIIGVAPSTAGGYGVDADDTAEFEALREEIMSRPELQKVKAVEEGEIYILSNHLVSFFLHAGCKQFIQIAYQAKWFHPDLFEDLDPKAIHQEYLTEFQGLDIDLDEHGVFVYPPLGAS